MIEEFSNCINYANHQFSEEAIYIYSLKENRLIYADGWEEVLGYKDNEITTKIIENSPAPEFEKIVDKEMFNNLF